MKNYIIINNEVTIKSLKERYNDKNILNAHKNRHKDEYQIFKKYVKKENSVLDVGCKDALWLDLLKQNGFTNLVGVDACEEAAAIVKKKGFGVYIGDVMNMKFIKDNSFNAITALHVLEHVPNPEKVVNEIFRILTKNGIVFVEIPTQEYQKPELWGHFNCFLKKDEINELFDEFRFELLEIDSMKEKSKTPWHRYIFRKI